MLALSLLLSFTLRKFFFGRLIVTVACIIYELRLYKLQHISRPRILTATSSFEKVNESEIKTKYSLSIRINTIIVEFNFLRPKVGVYIEHTCNMFCYAAS